MDGWMDGWMGGWMDGWMEAKAGLRIAYSNQKLTHFDQTYPNFDLKIDQF